MASPAVHPAESLEDAFAMFDGHVPLTAREKKFILQSLYDLGFREGARQGRQAGIEAAELVHEDPTVKIRRNLEEKQRALAELTKQRTTDNFTHPYPEHG